MDLYERTYFGPKGVRCTVNLMVPQGLIILVFYMGRTEKSQLNKFRQILRNVPESSGCFEMYRCNIAWNHNTAFTHQIEKTKHNASYNSQSRNRMMKICFFFFSCFKTWDIKNITKQKQRWQYLWCYLRHHHHKKQPQHRWLHQKTSLI